MIGAGFSLTEYNDSNFDNYDVVKKFDNLLTKDLIILHINNFRKIRAIKLLKEFFMPNILDKRVCK